jgi:dethiobiotin synthetase
MEKGYFITGTDTNVGKTWATVTLMEYFKSQGETVIGFKPVASGCQFMNGRWVNEDALLLQKHASFKLDYDTINPYAFELPVSPHIAGKHNPVNLDVVAEKIAVVKNAAKVILVEGAGGWYSPINDKEQNSHLAQILGLPVIMVVGIKLGCINHALLTYHALLEDGIHCLGWIAVCTERNILMTEQIITSVSDRLDVPLLGILPYFPSADFNLLAKNITSLKKFD